MSHESVIKRLLPRSLLGRSLMIIFTPLVLVQVVSGLIFFESHLDKMTLHLARGVAGEVAVLIELLRQNPDAEDRDGIFFLVETNTNMKVAFDRGGILPNDGREYHDLLSQTLDHALGDRLRWPYDINAASLEREVLIRVQLADGVLEVMVPRKRVFSSTAYVFILWTIGASFVLLGVAAVFMRNQVKPIRRLAKAAEAFGKGREAATLKPEGAREVRQAASAFMAMRERIKRQMSQRTDMLSGVSHDLRTPLTRMKLQLAMMGEGEGMVELTEDVHEMEHMLEGYLAFARGEGREQPAPTRIRGILEDVAAQARRNGALVDLHSEGELVLTVRPLAIKRGLTNLVENANRYADHVWIRGGRRDDAIEILVDDDGPGIPEDKREDVFKPFMRLEGSRNPETGGVGLGLSIARDVFRGHGGDVALEDSPIGGLRARVRLPI